LQASLSGRGLLLKQLDVKNMAKKKFQEILDRLPAFLSQAGSCVPSLLSNLVLIGEIPSPTFGEERRVRFISDRFAENGLVSGSVDEKGNAVAVLPGGRGDRSILLVAHADTGAPANVDHTIMIEPGQVTGPGVANNSLGVAVLAALPHFLEKMDVALDANLIFLAASRNLARGNLEGLRFFLQNNSQPVDAGICIQGTQLGHLSIQSLAMMRGEITCTVPEEYNWTRFQATGAIRTINEVINRINEIPLPNKPRSNIAFGSINGGSGFHRVARHAVLRFEVRSEDDAMIRKIVRQIRDICEDVSSQKESRIDLDVFAERKAGGIPFAHPLSRRARKILEILEVPPRVSPSTSEIFAFIERGIPALSLGISTGESLAFPDERVDVPPMAAGMAQLAALLLAIDGGFCDEHP